MSKKAAEKRYKVLFVGSEYEKILYEKSDVLKRIGMDITDIVNDYNDIFAKMENNDYDVIFMGKEISINNQLELAGRFRKEFPNRKTVVISEKAVTEQYLESFKDLRISDAVKGGKSMEKAVRIKHVFQNLLKSDIRERSEFMALANNFGLDLSSKHSFIVLKLFFKQDFFHDNKYELLELALDKELETKISLNDEGTVYLTALKDDNYVIMLQDYMVDEMVDFFCAFCEELNIKYKVGISTAFSKMEYITIAYKEALEAINRSKPDEKINNYMPETQKENDEIRHLLEFNRMIIHALESGLYGDIPNIVGMLFSELGNCDPDSAFNLCIGSIKDILEYFNLNEVGKFKIKYRFDILASPESDIYNFIKGTYLVNIIRIRDLLRNIPSEPTEHIIKKVQDIVLKDYSKYDLSLNSLSHELNISYGYLSKIFKEKTGTNFINYLTAIRMDNAKKLLLEGSSKIFEIANLVGYSSSGYFITTFKKYFGVSPGDYKARLTGEIRDHNPKTN